MIKKSGNSYHVKSKDGKKDLGGPYKTEKEARKRLMDVEYFKMKNGRHPKPGEKC